MNKKMREILAKIEEKTELAKSYMADGAGKDVAKAENILGEVDALRKEFEVEEKLFNLGKEKAAPAIAVVETKKTMDKVAETQKAFATMVKKAASGMKEGTNEDGGYTVPEDISTEIRHYRDAQASLLDLVRVEKVKTNSGSRTYQKKGDVDGFSETDENGVVQQINAPKYERVSYSIKKYTGFIPVTNELLNDSDANITKELTAWFGKNSAATANKLILAAIATNEQVNLGGLAGIKSALNIDLGQAYKDTSTIVTNDDGLDYLDNLTDANGRPLLNPDPTAPAKLMLRVGATVVPIKVLPNSALKSAENKIPFIIGDLKEAVTYWDREQMSIAASQTAVIGNINAFAQDLTLMRGSEREDVKVVDKDAFVNGYIEVTSSLAISSAPAKASETVITPPYTQSQLEKIKVDDLLSLAEELGIEGLTKSTRKDDIISTILGAN